MKRITATAAVLLCTLAARADEAAVIHERTGTPPGGRYEIVQSTLAARWTFKLDKATGRVWQLVHSSRSEDDLLWEEMPVEHLPRLASPAGARFQLFCSGLAARNTFLLDSQSGNSWVLVSNKDEAGNDAPPRWQLIRTE